MSLNFEYTSVESLLNRGIWKDETDYIGTIVYWFLGETRCAGILKDILPSKDIAGVICRDVNGKPAKHYTEIETNLLFIKTE